MSADEIIIGREGPVLTVTFNRPEARNAMTWDMYEGLYAACETADGDDAVRAMLLRGAGSAAFVAGTDISQFTEFTTGADGIAYEEKITRVVSRLETVRVPTVAAVQGFCVGGGLAIAAVCDLRIADRSARFGVPVARTIGNCLSMNTYSLLLHHLGPGRTLDMLLRARLFTAEEAHAAGFVAELCDAEELDERTGATVERLLGHAPLSMWAAKEAVRRMRTAALPDGDDIVAGVFASEDFAAGVRGFLTKETTHWTGR
ncbi:enoyl-CoA hydratase/carnithine racemase [Spinactinospora alkalitolerans]|uniref:Enoyl-CoA hydratase/carnithine racemase n=1 Tax=Spinactinospora alkalitolerans TaxID=687207 RepID=A0A852TRF5_9ACTN|nr:enoyl-CoA hydratase/isomerase family protein [Spinactinospora alkalitolerans]NYE45422.1 enoyl-CoA hydratase/carnithine racemase [Spinactinospora alkalitolerans]